MTRPFAASCEENKQVIWDVISTFMQGAQHVLEIGSGTGQHAVFFAEKVPHLMWQTSDLLENHVGIQAWLDAAQLPNTPTPLQWDVHDASWSQVITDVVFTANTLHIMPWSGVEALFHGVVQSLKPQGILIAYGPFNYHRCFTSESNARFDAWLKQRNSLSGIRDVDDLAQLAQQVGLDLLHDYAMPVNNRILVWRKTAS